MKKSKIIRWGITIFIGAALITAAIGYYLFNMPQRDVQATKTDYSFKSGQIVSEYLADASKANAKYLDEEGDSKILEISGQVSKISEDYNGQKVFLLKSANDKAGVSCTFTAESNASISAIQIGQIINVKGIIRSGATYDEDLGMYEDVIMEKCNIILK